PDGVLRTTGVVFHHRLVHQDPSAGSEMPGGLEQLGGFTVELEGGVDARGADRNERVRDVDERMAVLPGSSLAFGDLQGGPLMTFGFGELAAAPGDHAEDSVAGHEVPRSSFLLESAERLGGQGRGGLVIASAEASLSEPQERASELEVDAVLTAGQVDRLGQKLIRARDDPQLLQEPALLGQEADFHARVAGGPPPLGLERPGEVDARRLERKIAGRGVGCFEIVVDRLRVIPPQVEVAGELGIARTGRALERAAGPRVENSSSGLREARIEVSTDGLAHELVDLSALLPDEPVVDEPIEALGHFFFYAPGDRREVGEMELLAEDRGVREHPPLPVSEPLDPVEEHLRDPLPGTSGVVRRGPVSGGDPD